MVRLLRRAVAAELERVVPEEERAPEVEPGADRVVAVPETAAPEGLGLE
jgi:hypothetical protein